MFEMRQTAVAGCFEILPKISRDDRGLFIKPFHAEEFKRLGLVTQFAEEFYTVSKKDVLRGLHFQRPPADQVKLVYSISGTVFDVILDLRIGSPTYGVSDVFELTEVKANMVYMPAGIAHGFCALTENATMVYKVTSAYSPDHDEGILWSSIPIEWPIKVPIISKRDRTFPSFSDYKSPFKYLKS